MKLVPRVCVLVLAFLWPPGSWAVELVCPAAEKVTLIATFPGWHDNSYSPRSGPSLAFEGMRLNEQMVVCRYTVEGAKVVSFRRYAQCVVARGTWQEQGISRLCQATKPEECSLECSPGQEAK